MASDEIQDVEQAVAEASSSHRIWFVPILRALLDLGGSAAPKAVEHRIREQTQDDLSDLQFAHVLRGNHIRWARFAMTKLGLLAGPRGTWEVTPLGREYFARHQSDPPELSSVPELEAKEAGDISAPTETVVTTSMTGYEVPILRVLARGTTDKQALLRDVRSSMRESLLPGDLRITPRGRRVWHERTSFALTQLKQKGEARNPSRAVWEITESGTARLGAQDDAWSIAKYQNSKSLVRAKADGEDADPDATAPDAVSASSSIDRWSRLNGRLRQSVVQGVYRRIRPDLPPTGDGQQVPLARNVILYGPPGTGKTFAAKLIAEALTGTSEPGPESPWRIVQFHPSYAYEDFIQGLRPDLEQSTLRYQLSRGPFLEVCEAADDDPDSFHVLIVDEINRGDPARIFGELLYALEYRDQPVDLALGGQLVVPSNLVVIGTMNSVDRSVALVDYALRRRFAFVRVAPEPDAILRARGDDPGAALAATTLSTFNDWLSSQLDQEHTLGHSLFLNPAVPLTDESSLATVWQHDVLPLLEEYFFGDPDQLAAAAREWQRCVSSAQADVAGDEEAATTDEP